MKWRAVQSSVRNSESLAAVSEFAALLWFYMLPQTDSWGRLAGSPSKIRSECIPVLEVTDEKLLEALEELVAVGRISLYCVDGKWSCQVNDFDSHQPAALVNRRGPSAFPAPEQGVLGFPWRGHARSWEVMARSRGEERREEGPASNDASSESEFPTAGEDTVTVLRPEPAAPSSAVLAEVYECWRTERGKTHGRYATITRARRQKIETRLREFTPEQLKQAIQGVTIDALRWPDRARHDDITVIFRSREQVERFLEIYEQGGGRADDDAQPRYARA